MTPTYMYRDGIKSDDDGKDGTMSSSTVDSTERSQLESACASTPEIEVRRLTCVVWATYRNHSNMLMTWPPSSNCKFMARPL
ncbi:hypothetical protein SCLCIDRAFT_1217736 [Scleroderma citrinum Foug A]|uniref:Uncharacterized protein n=1 Tax=Scleroderma citrinum Foug A TaxID=1036808 RepID=A0A0C3DT68_9AGAM|nr:hypothetical protein SCLCIDRAFT_1217736 [Scleroderma citrinum Foug A]